MKVVIAGGGTGGHIFPALAVAGELSSKGAELVFVGTKTGLESELVPKKGWKIEYISAPRWKGQSPIKRLKALVQIPMAILRASKLLNSIKPDVVVGVGGYASFPVLMAASLKKMPTLLMEQNSIPGLANKILGRFAKKICVSFPVSEKYFDPKKTIHTGNPVRNEIKEVNQSLPSIQDKFVLMCFGGSQGAQKINEAIFASLRHLRERRQSLKIIHQIGFSIDIDIAKDIYEKEGFDADVYRFIDDIADCYSRAHLVICRAGATSIAELAVVARPAVLVPYPYAANDHQRENAKYITDNGGSILVSNEELTGEKVAEMVKEFMSSPDKLEAMNEAMKKMAKSDAAESIAEECFSLCMKNTNISTS